MYSNLHFAFIINGHNGAGKDEFVKQFTNAARDYGDHYKVSNISTIDPIKEMITRTHLWDGRTKDDASRQLMHDVKEAVDKYNNFTTAYTLCKVNNFRTLAPGYRTVSFVHCREPEKIQQLLDAFEQKYHDKFMVGTILVRRNSDNIASNSADQSVENFKYDIYIDNNSTKDDLYNQALNVVRLCDKLSGVDNSTPTVSEVDSKFESDEYYDV